MYDVVVDGPNMIIHDRKKWLRVVGCEPSLMTIVVSRTEAWDAANAFLTAHGAVKPENLSSEWARAAATVAGPPSMEARYLVAALRDAGVDLTVED
ncbi:hypothetical protein [Sediminicoccus sp. KRV36]|uniref:hypothetical protein n=1 Tax=Sediminicoccus sp. KRV36 TaxID=3133721 RepID=UPI002010B9D3|nr:hypothetical protein [Sediminicoccus rosea]UPY35530.1 hypothetical protein LHU95_15025 [Sediminicoccus rosea]